MGQCQVSANQRRVEILSLPVHQLKSDHPLEARLLEYPLRKLTLLSSSLARDGLIPDSGTSQIKFAADFNEIVQISLPFYGYLTPQLLRHIEKSQIRDVLLDDLVLDRQLYLTSTDCFSTRNFQALCSPAHLNILYEMHIYILIAQLNSPYLHRIENHFCIFPTRDLVRQYSQILRLESVETNLSLIIKARRKEGRTWSFSEFLSLMHCLVEAVASLHSAGFSHNDIRPSNVYYSLSKKCFILGSFSNVMFSMQPPSTVGDIHHSHGKNIYIKRKLSIGEANSVETYQNDVYALGMTLLSAFYLLEPLNRQKCAPHNRFLVQQYPFLKLIKMMTTSHEKRATIHEVQKAMSEYQSIWDNSEHFEDISFHVEYMDEGKRERSIADGYRTLGMISAWKERLDNRYIQRTVSQQTVETAIYFEELAIISSIEEKMEKSSNYFIRAAEIYLQIGVDNFNERDYDKAINYFECGLKNFKRLQVKTENLTYLKLIVSLVQVEIIYGSRLVGDAELKSIQEHIASVKQIEPYEYCNFLQQFCNIYIYYENYEKVDVMLHKQLDTVESLKTKVEELRIRKLIIENNIKLAHSRRDNRTQTQNKLIADTEYEILTILNDQEYYFIERPVEKLQMQFSHAKIKFIRGFTREGFTRLNELIQILLGWIYPTNDSFANDAKNSFFLLKCSVLEYLGQAHLREGDMEKSLDFYKQALKMYRQYFGDVYNIECALILENIGEINKFKGLSVAYADCMDLVMKILRTQYGQYHKDILRLNYQYKRSRQADLNFPRISPFKTETDISALTDL